DCWRESPGSPGAAFPRGARARGSRESPGRSPSRDRRREYTAWVLLRGSPRTAGPQPRDVLRLALPFFGSPRTAGPQPRDVLRLALPHALAAEAALPARDPFLFLDVVRNLAPEAGPERLGLPSRAPRPAPTAGVLLP